MLDKIAHVRKFNHIFLSSLTLMAINSKQQAKVITKNTHTHTTTKTPETATAKFQHYVNDSAKYISNL